MQKVNYANVQERSAKLSSDFGNELARKWFSDEMVDALPKLTRGKNKGKTKGFLTWVNVEQGGWYRGNRIPHYENGGPVSPGIRDRKIIVDNLEVFTDEHRWKKEFKAKEEHNDTAFQRRYYQANPLMWIERYDKNDDGTWDHLLEKFAELPEITVDMIAAEDIKVAKYLIEYRRINTNTYRTNPYPSNNDPIFETLDSWESPVGRIPDYRELREPSFS